MQQKNKKLTEESTESVTEVCQDIVKRRWLQHFFCTEMAQFGIVGVSTEHVHGEQPVPHKQIGGIKYNT